MKRTNKRFVREKVMQQVTCVNNGSMLGYLVSLAIEYLGVKMI